MEDPFGRLDAEGNPLMVNPFNPFGGDPRDDPRSDLMGLILAADSSDDDINNPNYNSSDDDAELSMLELPSIDAPGIMASIRNSIRENHRQLRAIEGKPPKNPKVNAAITIDEEDRLVPRGVDAEEEEEKRLAARPRPGRLAVMGWKKPETRRRREPKMDGRAVLYELSQRAAGGINGGKPSWLPNYGKAHDLATQVALNRQQSTAINISTYAFARRPTSPATKSFKEATVGALERAREAVREMKGRVVPKAHHMRCMAVISRIVRRHVRQGRGGGAGGAGGAGEEGSVGGAVTKSGGAGSGGDGGGDGGGDDSGIRGGGGNDNGNSGGIDRDNDNNDSDGSDGSEGSEGSEGGRRRHSIITPGRAGKLYVRLRRTVLPNAGVGGVVRRRSDCPKRVGKTLPGEESGYVIWRDLDQLRRTDSQLLQRQQMVFSLIATRLRRVRVEEKRGKRWMMRWKRMKRKKRKKRKKKREKSEEKSEEKDMDEMNNERYERRGGGGGERERGSRKRELVNHDTNTHTHTPSHNFSFLRRVKNILHGPSATRASCMNWQPAITNCPTLSPLKTGTLITVASGSKGLGTPASYVRVIHCLCIWFH